MFFEIVFFSTTSYTQSYLDPISGNSWDTLSPSNLNWCEENIDTLINFLEMTNTKSFIILKDGKIVLENYINGHSDTAYWYWASAAKSLMAVIVGKAQEEGYLNIEDSTSTYIGSGWTSCSSSQERNIKIKHQLMMTTGINDIGVDLNCIDDTCLFFLDTPNSRWAYHNAPYLLLRDVVESATGQGINMYINQKLNTQIGMFGFFGVNNTNLFYSNTRSMARFGLLVLNQGKWNGSSILNDSIYFNQDPVKNISGFDTPVISNSFKKGHRGLDITGPIGTKIYSILPGKVIFEGNDKKMGNIIIISHENGLISKYMHNKKNYIKVGDLIKLEKPIAEMGKTGSVLSKKEGIHLHFELWKNGVSINPFEYIKNLNTIDSEIKN